MEEARRLYALVLQQLWELRRTTLQVGRAAMVAGHLWMRVRTPCIAVEVSQQPGALGFA